MITKVNLLHRPDRAKPWVVRWYGDPHPQTGKQKRYGKSFRYCHVAKDFFAEKQSALNKGEARDPIDVTLEQLIGDFEEARLSGLSYSSILGYQNTISQMLEYFGSKRKIRDMRQQHAEAFIASRIRCDGRIGELSTWAKARHLIHSRAIFTAAVAWAYIDSNPFRAAREDGSSPLHINPKSRQWHHLTAEEFMRLMSVVDGVHKRAAYWLMYGCGLRPGEVYNLLATNIDLKLRRVHIASRSGTEDIPPFTIKAESQSSSSKSRSVPIPQAAIPDLTLAMSQSFKSGGLVTITSDRFCIVQQHWQRCRLGKSWGGHAHRPWQNRDMVNNMLRDTKKFLALAGVELTEPFTLPTFRKSFAQNHADAGTPPRTLAKLLGHSNTRVTLQFYNRVTDANERAAGVAMDKIFAAKHPSAFAG